MPLDAPPLDALRRRFDRHDWRPVTVGMSGALVWHLAGGRSYYLKLTPDAADEAARYAWLAGRGLPVPEVVDHRHDWLLTTAMPGRGAGADWPADRRDDVVDALADLARTLHALPIAGCPFDRTTPYCEDLVVSHGDYCVPNVLLDPHTLAVTALLDVGRLGVADRSVDLALATRSLADTRLNPQYGPLSAARFLAGYGGPIPSGERLALYRELDALD